ncbi:MAG: Transposase [Verrucomicrobiales bacterium]|nr:Transposase [Verrucomicrobiales bacterium]
MELTADWLKLIYQQIKLGVMAGGYVQVDETPIRYLEPGHGETRQGYLWVGSKPGEMSTSNGKPAARRCAWKI